MKSIIATILCLASFSVFAADCSLVVYNGTTTPTLDVALKGFTGTRSIGDFKIEVLERKDAMISVELTDAKSGFSAFGISYEGQPSGLDVALTHSSYNAVVSCTIQK